MFLRKCRAASDAALHLIEPDTFATFDRAGDGHQRAHSGRSIFDSRTLLRFGVQDRLSECFDLALVTVRICAKRAVELAVPGREAFHVARFMEPGQIEVALHAASLAVNLEALLKVAADRNGQVKMPHRPA